jgi:hypothetical protein
MSALGAFQQRPTLRPCHLSLTLRVAKSFRPPQLKQVLPAVALVENRTLNSVKVSRGLKFLFDRLSSGVTQNRPCRVSSKAAMLKAQDRSSEASTGVQVVSVGMGNVLVRRQNRQGVVNESFTR